VLHLLSNAVKEGVNLQTHTPVVCVTRSDSAASSSSSSSSSSSRPFLVETSRGSVRTSKVIYASNAYTSALLPEYKQAITPVKGICCHIVAKKKPAPLLSNSYSTSAL
jgi:glycine/D-amino acid oxidase-like deaminating enzyme